MTSQSKELHRLLAAMYTLHAKIIFLSMSLFLTLKHFELWVILLSVFYSIAHVHTCIKTNSNSLLLSSQALTDFTLVDEYKLWLYLLLSV